MLKVLPPTLNFVERGKGGKGIGKGRQELYRVRRCSLQSYDRYIPKYIKTEKTGELSNDFSQTISDFSLIPDFFVSLLDLLLDIVGCRVVLMRNL